MEENKEANKMGTMKVNKLMLTMGAPMILSMVLQAVYNIVDSAFVSNMHENGEAALNALTLAFPVQMMMVAIAIGTGVGMNALLSKNLGSGNLKKASMIAGNTIFLGTIIYLIFLVFGIFGADFYVSTQTSNELIKNMAIQYLKICCTLSIGIVFFSIFEKMLQATGRSLYSTIAQILGAVTNMILDPILIFGLFGAPKMGVTGAAIATVIGQCVAGIVAAACNHKYNHDVKLSFKGFKPDLKIIGTIYAVGVPSIIMQSIGSIMTYCMNRILIEFSSTATAVFGVYFKLQSFFFMPVFGLNNGITPIIAYNYGAKQRKRMIHTIKLSMAVAFCLTFVGFIAFEAIPQVLLGMFNSSQQLLEIGIPALRIIGIHFLIAWFCIVAGTVFQALGKAVFSMIVSIMRQLFVLVPAAYILAKVGGLHAVWWSFPIAEIISLAVSLTFLIRIYNTIIKKLPEGRA